MGRDRYPKQSLGVLHTRIKQSRVLLVGAGGIGCELLKNLVLTGFGQIHVVDLDTIDLSNLNRQFLFRQEHIQKSKALVAKESAAKFNPQVQIEAHHANIKDPQFNVDWFQSFAIVFNALDNLDARRHVNKMCLAADIPLVESGTTGFNGQVQVIKKGETECYDCNPKEPPKSFPVCTIRSTPSQPIHCIVWAKSYLFSEIFGTSEDETHDIDQSEDSDNAREIEKLRQEAQALRQIRQSIGSDNFPREVFNKTFRDDIHRLQSMEDMWKTRKAPLALDYDEVSKNAEDLEPFSLHRDQAVWNLKENLTVFTDSLGRLSRRLKVAQLQAAKEAAPPILTFDKDDEDALDFVTSSANLRSIIFGIETKSKFDIKQMAGNIIPAIATTNAMTAGLCVLQAFKVMRENLMKAKMVFLERSPARIINTDTLRKPNSNCSVCGIMQSRLVVDTARATLKDLVQDVLQAQLGYGDELSVNNDIGTLYDPELDDNLSKNFSDLGIKVDSFLTVVDDNDNDPRVNLSLSISEKTLPEDSKPILILDKPNIIHKLRSTTGQNTNDDINSGLTIRNGTSSKRKRNVDAAEIDDSLDQIAKRGKVYEKSIGDDTTVLVTDEGNGAILIDDD